MADRVGACHLPFQVVTLWVQLSLSLSPSLQPTKHQEEHQKPLSLHSGALFYSRVVGGSRLDLSFAHDLCHQQPKSLMCVCVLFPWCILFQQSGARDGVLYQKLESHGNEFWSVLTNVTKEPKVSFPEQGSQVVK